jgi:DNA-binding IclR family transcriptional regulator
VPKVRSGQPVRSAERLLDVLLSFSAAAPLRTNAEVSQSLDLAPSTVRRLLLALASRGLVRLDRAGGLYRLGAIERLARVAWAGELVNAAQPYMDKLHEETSETVILAILDGAEGVHVDVRHSRQFGAAFDPVGYRVTPYAGGAIGKVLLAWLPERQIRTLLPTEGQWAPRTRRSIITTDRYLRHLAKVRHQGYAVNDAETDEKVWAIAAPVYDSAGRVDGALHVPVPRSRLHGQEAKRQLIDAVVATAAGITDALARDDSL